MEHNAPFDKKNAEQGDLFKAPLRPWQCPHWIPKYLLSIGCSPLEKNRRVSHFSSHHKHSDEKHCTKPQKILKRGVGWRHTKLVGTQHKIQDTLTHSLHCLSPSTEMGRRGKSISSLQLLVLTVEKKSRAMCAAGLALFPLVPFSCLKALLISEYL